MIIWGLSNEIKLIPLPSDPIICDPIIRDPIKRPPSYLRKKLIFKLSKIAGNSIRNLNKVDSSQIVFMT
jgi:hypothetical protein